MERYELIAPCHFGMEAVFAILNELVCKSNNKSEKQDKGQDVKDVPAEQLSGPLLRLQKRFV